MKRLTTLMLAGAGLVWSTGALAVTEWNRPLQHVGVQDNTGYIKFDTLPVSTCAYDVVYVDLSGDGGKARFSALISAYLAGKPLSRIDYTITNGTCLATLIEI